jgi:dTMP kinase
MREFGNMIMTNHHAIDFSELQIELLEDIRKYLYNSQYKSRNYYNTLKDLFINNQNYRDEKLSKISSDNILCVRYHLFTIKVIILLQIVSEEISKFHEPIDLYEKLSNDLKDICRFKNNKIISFNCFTEKINYPLLLRKDAGELVYTFIANHYLEKYIDINKKFSNEVIITRTKDCKFARNVAYKALYELMDKNIIRRSRMGSYRVPKDNKIIVIEGMDGSGKTLIIELLIRKLGEYDLKPFTLSFPDYTTNIGAEITNYLNSKVYADRTNVDDVIGASMLYGMNRHQSFYLTKENGRLIDKVNDGELIICNRYTTSNLLYMSANFIDKDFNQKSISTARNICDIIQKIEYDLLYIPNPRKVYILKVTPEISYSHLMKRYNGVSAKCDKNETLEFQTKVYKTIDKYNEITRSNAIIIDCMKDEKTVLEPELIVEKILNDLKESIIDV